MARARTRTRTRTAKPKAATTKTPRKRRSNNRDDEDAEVEDERHQELMEITPEMIKELKNIDVKNYPIPANLNAAYKMDGKQRLMIERMVLENFKSYFGKQLIGPFHPHFSAIVGANGSGKSNIIDALMFVFGSKCTKIRSTNVKALIHKSANHQNLTFCSVTISFVLCQDEDEDKYTLVPGTGFTVKRTVTSKGVSKYFYNNEVMNRTDLRNTLREHGIDMDHNRFLILQGEVESISTMKPKAEKDGDKGLLEYLDDIIGTSRLRDEVINLDRKVVAFDALRQKQLMKVQEYDKMRHKLVKPVREMVKILVADNRLAHSKHRLLTYEMHSKNKALAESRERKAEVDALLAEETEQLEQVIAGNTEARAAVTVKTKEHEKAKNSQRKQKEQLDREQMKLKRAALNLEKAETAVTSKQKEKSKIEENIKKLENRPSKNAAESEKLKNELEELKSKIEELRPELEEKNKEANARNRELEAERTPIGNGLAEVKKAEEEANSKLTLAQSNQMRMREALEKAERRYDESRLAFEKLEEDFHGEERKIKETTEKLSTLEPRHNKAVYQVESLTRKEQELSNKLNSFKQEYRRVERENHSLQSANSTVEKFMEEKRSGRIPGICGRLGDLGNIDPKYDVAISTTTNLDYIVTDTFETTKQCLAFMEKHKLQRTTFLSLDKIQDMCHKMRPIRTPNDYPRLFDLVKPVKPEYAVAFYFVLKDTIVCDDIIKARAVSNWQNKRWRIVTLGAEVVDPSGTLTGGGSSVRRGKIGTNVNAAANNISEADLANLKRKMDECQQDFDQVRDQLSRMMVEKTEVTTSYEREKRYYQMLNTSYKQHEADLQFMKNNIIQLKADLEKEKASLTDEKIERVKNEVQRLTKERDDLTKECEAFQEKYDHISAQISSIYQSIAGEVKTAFDKYQAREKEVEKKLSDLRKSSSKVEIDLEAATTNLKTVIENIEEAEENIQKYTAEKEECEEIIERLEVLLKEKEEAVKKIEDEIKEESEKADQNNEEEVKLSKSIKQRKTEKDALKANIARIAKIVDDYVAQDNALKLHDLADLLDDDTLRKKPKKKTKRAKHSDDEDEEDGTDLEDFEMEEVDDDEDIEDDIPMEVDGEDDDAAAATSADNDEMDEIRLTELIQYTDEDIENFKLATLEDDLENCKEDRKAIKTDLNLNVLQEYRKRSSEFKQEQSHLHDLSSAVFAVQNIYDRFVTQRLEEFNIALNIINDHLRNQYYSLSLGGEAYLQAVSPMDAYSDGIKFIVRPKSKGWREIAMTSGGEKTISSLSLVFALHQYMPTPFYVMDEIDAALDFRNVAMISKFVKEKTKNSQFIIISLRDNMYQLANSLIGVYKVQDKAQTCLLRHEVKKNTNNRRVRAPIMPA